MASSRAYSLLMALGTLSASVSALPLASLMKRKENSDPPVAAIAGGAVGCIVAISGAVIIAVLLVSRHRQRLLEARIMAIIPEEQRPSHIRSPSDVTDKSGMSMKSSISGFPTTGYAPTVRSHGSSSHHYSTFAAVPPQAPIPTPNQPFAVRNVTPPPATYRREKGPPPFHMHAPSSESLSSQRRRAPQEKAAPYHLHAPSSESLSSQRRRAQTPTHDSHNVPPLPLPSHLGDDRADSPRRGHISVNPPAYSPLPPPNALSGEVSDRSAYRDHTSRPTQESFTGRDLA